MKKIILFLLFSIAAYAQPNITLPEDLVICDTDGSGYATFDISINTTLILSTLNPADYSVSYHQTYMDAEFDMRAISNIYNNVIPNEQTLYVRVTNINDSTDFAVASFSLVVNQAPLAGQPAPLVNQDVNNPGDETEIFDLTAAEEQIRNGYPPNYLVSYYSSFDAAHDGTPVIVQPQSYMSSGPVETIFFRLENPETGCYTVGLLDIRVQPEVQQPAGATTQTFTEGQTLADLEVTGTNVMWYGSEAGIDLLPQTTVLVNNTTYYASQTINGLPSARRLGVTVSLMAGHSDNALSHLNVYPNPASSVLNFKNNTNITRIVIYNTVGQQVLSRTATTFELSIDMSALSNGIYFAEIQATEGKKTVRFIKE